MENSSRLLKQSCNPRPDLEASDFQAPDWAKIFGYGKVLDHRKLFRGKATEPLDPSIIEFSKDFFRGGNGIIVYSAKICGQWFAVKRIWTPEPLLRERYEKELENLQTIRSQPHRHIIQLLGFYSNQGCRDDGNLLLSPLAECTLQNYLSHKPRPERKGMVQKWFGCLAGALEKIHDQNMKHKDLKPGNLLIHGDNIVITDMNISNHFDEGSTSYGDSPGTWIYKAPEVHKLVEDPQLRRRRKQDIWSLTCCYIDMLAYLFGYTIQEFRESCAKEDAPRFSFYCDFNSVVTWLDRLKTETKDQSLLGLIDLIRCSFKLEEMERPAASDLFARFQEMPMFVGECCASVQTWREASCRRLSFPLSTNLQSTIPGSLFYFVLSAGRWILSRQNFPSAEATMCELLEEVEQGNVRSLRTAERKAMLYIAPRRCGSTREYLSFCKAYYEQLVKAVESGQYPLYDAEEGEADEPYTTAYFAVLVELILSRCRTSEWFDDDQDMPSAEPGQLATSLQQGMHDAGVYERSSS